MSSPRGARPQLIVLSNSFVGRPGNLGSRAIPVLEEASRRGWRTVLLARGAEGESPADRLWTLGPLGHVPRLLNGARIYLHREFRHRLYDIALFETALRIWDAPVRAALRDGGPVVCWSQEYAPQGLTRWRDRGAAVALDVPMAPARYTAELLRRHGPVRGMSDTGYMDPIERRAFGIADRLFSPSSFVTQELLNCGTPASRIREIRFGATLPQRGLDAGRPEPTGLQYLFAGAVSERKGVGSLLEAWDCPAFQHDTLVLCGRLYPEIREAISRRGLGNVLTPGFVPLDAWLRSSQAFVFPSLLEGSAKAVLEAMAYGLAPICTPAAGAPVAHEENGLLVPVLDSSALRAAMLRLKTDPALRDRLGRAARASVEDRSWAAYAREVVDELASLSASAREVG